LFQYENNQLVLKQGHHVIPLQNLATRDQTPFYIYDIQGLKSWFKEFVEYTDCPFKVFFAMKANNNPHILRALREEGSGVDVVSIGESRLAQSIGFSPQEIIFSGVAKSVKELEEAIAQRFFQINVESVEELKRIIVLAQKQRKRAIIGLRLNPNVDVETHPHIKTGLMGHKFGIDENDLPHLLEMIKSHKEELCFQGLSLHIGSQIFDLDSLFKAIKHVKSVFDHLQPTYTSLKTLDLGGGLGVDYNKEGLEADRLFLNQFKIKLSRLFRRFSGQVLLEPGRFLVARFGLLCAQIEYVKVGSHKKFLILNSGMNHFLRPVLYGAQHKIWPFIKDVSHAKETYDVVGPICETGDTLAKNYKLASSLKAGDWLALADTGAYGYVMSNNYNLQIPVQEICIANGKRL